MANAFGKPTRTRDDEFEFQLPETLGGRGRIKAGDYIGRCVSVEADTSKTSGNPMWTWTFVITKGPYAGRDFKQWTVLTDDAAWKIVETLKGLGIPSKEGERVHFKKKQVIGAFCTLKIVDDEYNGSETSKLQTVAAHPSGAGYRGGIAGQTDEDETTPIDRDNEGEEPPKRSIRRPVPARRGAAPVIGKGKKR